MPKLPRRVRVRVRAKEDKGGAMWEVNAHVRTGNNINDEEAYRTHASL